MPRVSSGDHIAAYRPRFVPIYHHGVFIKTGFYREFTSRRKYQESVDRITKDKSLWQTSATLAVSGENASRMWLEITTTDDDLVIDFDDKGMHLTTYANFKNGCKLYKIDHDDAYPADIVCERAIDNYLQFSDAYHALNCNCESVANYIVTGKKTSHQARRVVSVVAPPLAPFF